MLFPLCVRVALYHFLIKHCVCVNHSVVPDSFRSVTRQAPLSMGFFRQEYWNGLPLPSSRELPDPVIKPGSPALKAESII